jgi:hypothetical protein
LGRCVREKCFQELYQASGKKTEQDHIRAAYPDVTHCRWLQEDPNACDCFPFEIEGAKIGDPCPNNPYEREGELFSSLQDHAALLGVAHYIEDLIDLNILPQELSPEDFMVARMMRQRAKVQEMQMKSLAGFGG